MPRTANPWIVILAAASFFFYQFMQVAMFNTLKPELIIVLNSNSTVLSLISSLYFFGTVIFLIPAGVMLDNYSTRTIMLVAMLLSLIGLYIFSIATSAMYAGIGRFVIGISAGPVYVSSCMRLASRWFGKEQFAFVTGVIVAIGMLGGIVAQTPFSLLISSIGLESALDINLGLGFFIFLGMYLFIQDFPSSKEQEYRKQLGYYRQHGFMSSLKKVLFNPQNWYCGIFAQLLNLPILLIGAFLGVMYLTQIFHLSKIQASVASSAIFLGMLIGAPIFGFISDKLALRKAPMYAGLFICFIATAMVYMFHNLTYPIIVLLFFVIGFSSSAQVLAFPMATESNLPALSGTVLGLISTLIMSGGAIFQPLTGYLIQLKWNGSIINGMPNYSANNYGLVFWVMLIGYIIATFMVILTKESYGKPIDSQN